ncbi:FAD:protein FMN transferase [Saccharospirillum mangrovi]|uniref:FAD:protein FMN transferase n=1 Tax=Saccharospirillum mangrovi TaxID=2161747 RepID=UPI000D396AD6|nr:FAD:protein FMN transferase [Saccharospirillum mangrovi]
MQRSLRLDWQGDAWLGRFDAMASPCEVLLALPQTQRELARRLLKVAADEVWRIEQRYSRYRTDNLFAALHAQPGQSQRVDAETARLLNFAEQAWRLSDGRFDLTSGLLRQVWKFDGSDRLPTAEAVAALLPRIGWQQLDWRSDDAGAKGEITGGWLTIPAGMELDFGGIGKEYAADRALGLCLQAIPARWRSSGILVNLGGDLACSGPRADQQPWRVGVEAPEQEGQSALMLKLAKGGLATSGDSRRFLLCDGRRYSHLLDPITGWPVENAPRSVTVAAPSCIQSGLVASLAMLAGADARAFLEQTGLPYWIVDA